MESVEQLAHHTNYNQVDIRKPGQRLKSINAKYRGNFSRIMNESRTFAKIIKARRLNKNFKPKMKIIKEIRWNTDANNLKPFINQNNFKMVKKIRKYWIHRIRR